MAGKSSRRAILAGFVATPASLNLPAAAVRSAVAPVDPVFPLVAAEQKAWAAFMDAPDRTSNEFGALAADAMNAVLRCDPTTPAGVAAMIDTYVSRNGGDFIGDPDVMRLLGLASAFLSGPSASEAATRSGEA